MMNGTQVLASPSVSTQKGESHSEHLKSSIFQLAKFGMVGVLNTTIDFGVLNVLSWATGITKGVGVTVIALISFTLAITNSFFWNRFWTFRQKGTKDVGVEGAKFFVVSLIGAGINAVIVYTVSTHIQPLFGLSEQLWLNAAKLVSTFCVFTWNFVGYKYWAFKHPS